MRYQLYQAQLDMAAPFQQASRFGATILHSLEMPGVEGFVCRAAAAGLTMAGAPSTTHTRPDFGITQVMVDDTAVAVTEEVSLSTPFCDLTHFRKATDSPGPRLLVVAPMSGHFATLLRGTVQTLLIDHDVTITDWRNARDVPVSAGHFDFDDYIELVIRFVTHLGPGTHLLAVCQPATPVLAAVSIMAANNDHAQPASMTLMGGPIHPSADPTQVSKLAAQHPMSWFESNLIDTVPAQFKGGGRRVYPGFMQLAAFLSMNPDRHMRAHLDHFNNLVRGDEEGANAHRNFYHEYTSVMDMPAEFYLQTIKTVFQDQDLANGTMVWHGQKVDPATIHHTALFTISGELDDICAYGQTRAAQDLCSGLPATMKQDLLQLGTGHYGIFNGRRWREQVYPAVRDFIAAHEALAANDAAAPVPVIPPQEEQLLADTAD